MQTEYIGFETYETYSVFGTCEPYSVFNDTVVGGDRFERKKQFCFGYLVSRVTRGSARSQYACSLDFTYCICLAERIDKQTLILQAKSRNMGLILSACICAGGAHASLVLQSNSFETIFFHLHDEPETSKFQCKEEGFFRNVWKKSIFVGRLYTKLITYDSFASCNFLKVL